MIKLMANRYKIGIVCLANGPYKIFIDDLIESCNDKFLIEHEKEYFIITDGYFKHNNDVNCRVIHKRRNGYPLDCLLRPEYSYELKESLLLLDYVYFFNANMLIRTIINEDILPDESGLVGVEHPLSINQKIDGYERNPNSNAYIPIGDGNVYYQACLWGGTSEAFIELSKTITEWTNDDTNRGVFPIWYDESYLNKYFFIYQPKLLPPTYAYPVGFRGGNNFPLNANVKIIQIQKEIYLPNNFKYT